jgi:hypothetical protein
MATRTRTHFRNRNNGEVVEAMTGTALHARLDRLPNWDEVDPTNLPTTDAPPDTNPVTEAPAQSATKAEWVDYAVARGADRAEAEATTKANLVALFGE